MPVCVPRTHISNRPDAPIGNISLLIFHLSPYLPIKKRAQPNFFEPSAAKAIHLHYSFSQRQLLSHVSTLWISHRGYQRNVFTFSTVKMLKTRLKVWKTKRVFHTLHAKVVFSWGYMPARQQNIELLPWRCYNKHTVYRPDCPLWLWKTVPDGAENAEFSTNRRAYALDR